MSKNNSPNQIQISVMNADEKMFAHGLEVVVQQHLQRGKLTMIQIGGILRHAATMVDLRIRAHLKEDQGPQIEVAPAGLETRIKPPTGD